MTKWEQIIKGIRFQTDSSQKIGIECDLCQDIGWIRQPGERYEQIEPCICTVKKQNERMLANSGIAEAFKSKRLDEYQGTTPEAVKAKKAAASFLEKFHETESQESNSIGFFGQVGSGKTHLTVAVANELMEKGVQVRCMQYRPAIDQIKRNRMDEVYYHKQTMPFKNCRVLLIDDLFKGAVRNGELNQSDLQIIFDLIDHRYLNKKPMIISSEFYPDKIMALDGAIGGRIVEMCRMHTVQFKDPASNHRLKGIRVVR